MSVIIALLVSALISYGLFMGQIAIHNCVHCTLFRSRRMNRIAGNVLCAIQLTHFEGWRVAHFAHHRWCNSARDPHRVDRPLLPYLATHYLRIARYVWDPWRFLAAISGPVLCAVAVIGWQAAAGHGARGLGWVVAFWLVPVCVSHTLVAHFNYATHAGLPEGRGQDTRNLSHGPWVVINRLTFNFYLHLEHHLRPSEPVPVLRTRED